MRIVIIGAGAMGSLFGAMLSSVSELCLIDHSEDHVRAVNENGLLVEENDGSTRTYPIFATMNPESVEPDPDLAIIFTKSYSTRDASRTAKLLLREKGLAMTLQNGLGNVEAMAEVLGKEKVVAGVTAHGGTLVKPGHVRHAGRGPTHIAKSSANEEKLNQIAETFRAAGIDTDLSDNLDSLVWGKLIINVGINAMAAILRVPNGVLGVTPECERIMKHAVSEALSVAEKLGIRLPYDNPWERVREVCAATAENRASMLQDILRSKGTEIGAINRAVANKGERLGIPTPYNAFLSEIVEALEATSEKRCM